MAKYLFMPVLLSFLLQVAYPQAQIQEQKKVTKDKKLYINKNLGVYLWLSTSPNKDSEKIRLFSDSTKQFSNPMYFDTEGYNTVRSPSAVDTNSKRVVYPTQDIVFEVYSDGRAPVSRITFSKTKSIYLNKKLYLAGDVKAGISFYDAISGVQKTYYSINGAAFQIYSKEFNVTTEGKSKIKFYSVDKVGNIEEVKEKTVYVDNSAPITKYEIVGEFNENSISSKAKIKLTSTDSLSGVKTIYYRINNGNPKVYSYPVSVKYLGNLSSFSFYAVDKTGNKEKLKSIEEKDKGLIIGKTNNN